MRGTCYPGGTPARALAALCPNRQHLTWVSHPTVCPLKTGALLAHRSFLKISSLPGICLDTWQLSIKEIHLLNTFPFSFSFFLDFIYLFMRDKDRDKDREAETQAEGEAGSMQGARHGT